MSDQATQSADAPVALVRKHILRAVQADLGRRTQGLVVKQSFWSRFWNRLGFRVAYPDRSHMEDDPNFAGGALMVVTKVSIDWPDRIRILISGRASVVSRTITDVPFGVAITHSAFGVPAPWSPLK